MRNSLCSKSKLQQSLLEISMSMCLLSTKNRKAACLLCLALATSHPNTILSVKMKLSLGWKNPAIPKILPVKVKLSLRWKNPLNPLVFPVKVELSHWWKSRTIFHLQVSRSSKAHSRVQAPIRAHHALQVTACPHAGRTRFHSVSCQRTVQTLAKPPLPVLIHHHRHRRLRVQNGLLMEDLRQQVQGHCHVGRPLLSSFSTVHQTVLRQLDEDQWSPQNHPPLE